MTPDRTWGEIAECPRHGHHAGPTCPRCKELARAMPSPAIAAPVPCTDPHEPQPRQKGAIRPPHGMPNEGEAEYRRLHLDRLAAGGAVVEFESVSLSLPGGVSYTPDFRVTWPNGDTEYHEVKGKHLGRRAGRTVWRIASGCIPGLWVWAERTREATWRIEVRSNGQEVRNG